MKDGTRAFLAGVVNGIIFITGFVAIKSTRWHDDGYTLIAGGFCFMSVTLTIFITEKLNERIRKLEGKEERE